MKPNEAVEKPCFDIAPVMLVMQDLGHWHVRGNVHGALQGNRYLATVFAC
jgi:hypothetical protein